VRRLNAILLAEEAVPLAPDDPTPEILLAELRKQGLGRFFEDPSTLRARVELMRRLEPATDWPDFSEAGLMAGLEDWLGPWLREGEGIRQLRQLSLEEVLLGALGWDKARRLDALLPVSYETPAGSRRRIHYPVDGPPSLDVPLQEMLGEASGPLLAEGRVALVLQLVSPAGRPLQKTSDLAAFWRGAYESVKKEMRGRYPKHYWPDDPLHAKPTRFTKRRMGQDN
jgi:ATP-dependent helicase HrpB